MTQSCKRHVLLVAAIGFFASCQLIPDLVPLPSSPIRTTPRTFRAD